ARSCGPQVRRSSRSACSPTISPARCSRAAGSRTPIASSRRRELLVKHSWLVVFLVACGGSNMMGGDHMGGSSVPRKLIATGGVSDAPLGGELHVYVVEQSSSTPIANAAVRVETSTPLTGMTDATGLASFTDGGLTNKVTVTATAPGHAAAT